MICSIDRCKSKPSFYCECSNAVMCKNHIADHITSDISITHIPKPLFVKLTKSEKQSIISALTYIQEVQTTVIKSKIDEKNKKVSKILDQLSTINKECAEYLNDFKDRVSDIVSVFLGTLAEGLNCMTSEGFIGTLRELKANSGTLSEDVIKFKLNSMGFSHPEISESLFHKAEALYDQGRFDEAVCYYKQAVESRKSFGGVEIATYLHNMGIAFRQTGKLQEALDAYSEALEIRKNLLGKDHVDVALTFNNIGVTYGNMGRHQEALQAFSSSLEIREQCIGSNQLQVAESLHNIGFTYFNIKQPDEALQSYFRALEIRRAHSANKADTANTLNNIGVTYHTLSKMEDALNYYFEALKIRKEALGDHVDVAITLHNIAYVYDKMRNYSEALQYYSQSSEIKEKLLGPQHPSTKNTAEQVGIVQRRIERLKELNNNKK